MTNQHANVAFYLRSDSTDDVLRVVQRAQDFAEEQFGRAESADNGQLSHRDPAVHPSGALAGQYRADDHQLGDPERLSYRLCGQWVFLSTG